jgi:hypothetical protein
VRSGCDASDAIIAHVESGTKAEILLSLSSSVGKCYKIRAGEIRGYVPASALAETELYEIAVRLAPALTSTAAKASATKTKSPAVARASNDAVAVNDLVRATRLLNEHQPRAALELLQPGLATAGFDQLVIAGAAARAADDPRMAVGLLEKALAIRPDRAVEQLLAAARKELSGDRSSERLAATRFILRYEADALQPETARTVVALLEQEYSRIAAELGCRTEERIVTIVQTAQAYRASSEAAEWSGGHFDGTRIRIPVTNSSSVDARTREALSHELVHACLANLGEWPSWLHEGFAMKLSGRSTSLADRHKVRSLVRQGKLPRLENLSQSWTRMSREAALNAYLYSLTAVEGLYEMHRSTGIPAVLRNPERLPQLAAELDKQMVQ